MFCVRLRLVGVGCQVFRDRQRRFAETMFSLRAITVVWEYTLARGIPQVRHHYPSPHPGPRHHHRQEHLFVVVGMRPACRTPRPLHLPQAQVLPAGLWQVQRFSEMFLGRVWPRIYVQHPTLTAWWIERYSPPLPGPLRPHWNAWTSSAFQVVIRDQTSRAIGLLLSVHTKDHVLIFQRTSPWLWAWLRYWRNFNADYVHVLKIVSVIKRRGKMSGLNASITDRYRDFSGNSGPSPGLDLAPPLILLAHRPLHPREHLRLKLSDLAMTSSSKSVRIYSVFTAEVLVAFIRRQNGSSPH
jgi:hypothetical protein